MGQTNIVLPIGEVKVKADINYQKVKEGELFPKHRIVHRTPEGKRCISVNSTVLEGSGKRILFYTSEKVHIDEDGKLIPSADVVDWLVEDDGKESQVTKFEQNMKKGVGVSIDTKVPRDMIRGFVIGEIYEIITDDEEQKWNLWQIAKELWDKNEIGIIKEVVLQSGYTVRAGLLVPFVDYEKDYFYLELQLTTKKREPNAMAIPKSMPTGTTSVKEDDAKQKHVQSLLNNPTDPDRIKDNMEYTITEAEPWVDGTWIIPGEYPVINMTSYGDITILADTYDDKEGKLLHAKDQEVFIKAEINEDVNWDNFSDHHYWRNNPSDLTDFSDILNEFEAGVKQGDYENNEDDLILFMDRKYPETKGKIKSQALKEFWKSNKDDNWRNNPSIGGPYHIEKREDGSWDVIDGTGDAVVEGETYQVASNVEYSLNNDGNWQQSETQDVADNINLRRWWDKKVVEDRIEELQNIYGDNISDEIRGMSELDWRDLSHDVRHRLGSGIVASIKGKTYKITENPGGEVCIRCGDKGTHLINDKYSEYWLCDLCYVNTQPSNSEDICPICGKDHDRVPYDTIQEDHDSIMSRRNENPGIPTKEFWKKFYPKILKEYSKKYGKDKAEEIARKVVGSIWYHKMKPKTKFMYEKIRKTREVKANPGEVVSTDFKCPECGSSCRYFAEVYPDTRWEPGYIDNERVERGCEDTCSLSDDQLLSYAQEDLKAFSKSEYFDTKERRAEERYEEWRSGERDNL